MQKYFGSWTWAVVIVIVVALIYLLQKWTIKTIIGIILLVFLLFFINPDWFAPVINKGNPICEWVKSLKK